MTLKNCILGFLKIRYRFLYKDSPLDFCAQVRNTKKILVSLPSLLEERKVLQRYLKKLPEFFPNAEIHFLIQNVEKIPKNLPSSNIIVIKRDQLRFRFYPNRMLINKIQKLGVDVYIDFNKHFDFVSVVLCNATKATIKIGFEDNRREPFFNLQIKAAPDSTGSKSYKSIFNFIESCTR
jgi:ADP-heptose:LPS heptosyltransferase